MKPILKVAIVAGYLLAFLIASAVVALHSTITGQSGAQASGGMSAFGDLVLFVAVFAAVGLVPTGAGFFFLLSKGKKPKYSPDSMPASVPPVAGPPPRNP